MRYDDIYDRIDYLCKERGWSAYKLMQESGVSESTYYNMRRRESVPRIDLIQKLCDGFNITLSEFFDDGKETDENEMLLETLKTLDNSQRQAVLAYITVLKSMQNKK